MSMSIPDALIEEVRNRADLVEIVSEQTRLRRSGKTFRGPCPLHGGEGPNFSVDPTRNIYKCFVCGESGDVFSFPMKHFGMSFTEAVRWVAHRVGVEIPEEQARREEDDPYAELHQANAFASEWFLGKLLDAGEGLPAREYLSGRGISPESCERFGIGWAPEGWVGLAEAAKTHGIRREVLLQLGLLKQPTKGGRDAYDAFRGRIVFPIEALSGRVVAFGGRLIAPAEAHIPKYLNSPESPVYHKGDLLYGLRWSRGAIRKEEVALVVEGYMDYVSLAGNGIENVVAPLGTAFTSHQAELLTRYTQRVMLLFDSDAAGLKATFRAADELLRAGAEVLVATLPEGEDPDSLVRKGGAALLRRYLADAIDVMDRKIQILERRNYFSSIAGKRRAVDALLPTVRATADEVLRGLYIDRVAERAGLPRETVEREAAAGEKGPRSLAPKAESQPSQPQASRKRPQPRDLPLPTPRLGPERNIVLLLLRDEQWIEKAAERLGPEDFRDPIFAEIFAELLQLHAAGGRGEGLAWLQAIAADAGERVEELLGDPEGANMIHPDRFFEENIREIEYRSSRERLAQLERRLGDAPPGERQQEILREMETLRREMQRSGFVIKPGVLARSDGAGDSRG
jgi:DNA primase